MFKCRGGSNILALDLLVFVDVLIFFFEIVPGGLTLLFLDLLLLVLEGDGVGDGMLFNSL